MSAVELAQAKAQRALAYFAQGCNCAQAVFTTFYEEMGLSEDAAMRLSSSMGGGIAGLRDDCGAFTGMCMALGALKGFAVPKDQEEKQRHYAMIREKAEQIVRAHGSLICRELLERDLARTAGGKATVCPQIVEMCARFVAEELENDA
jgi:C_GCAxxG_C_C family probable redox protein